MRLQSRKHFMLDWDEEHLMDAFLMQCLERTPDAHIGERFSGPTCYVVNGKIHKEPDVNKDDVFELIHQPKAQVIPKKLVQAKSRKFHFDDFDGYKDLLKEHVRVDGTPFYVHGYKVQIPFRKLLTEHKAGDTIWVVNSQFEHQEYVLTEKDIYDHSFVVVSFAISD